MTTKSNARRRGTGIKALTRGALVVCSFIFAAVAVARQPSGGSAAGLDGRWYHDGKPTRILVAPDGRSITIVNEFGQSSDGYANGPHTLVIPPLALTLTVTK